MMTEDFHDQNQPDPVDEEEERRHKKQKRRRIMLVVLAVLVILIAFDVAKQGSPWGNMNDYIKRQGLDIEIINSSDYLLSGWQLIYDGNKKENVPDIKPGQEFYTTLSNEETEGEQQVLLQWSDKTGEIKEKVILGYYKKGYDAKVLISVRTDGDGSLLIEPRSSYY
jgi:hypothetical protein